MTDPSDISVFISYGRRDATAFVDKLAADLQRAGFTVWRDTADLRSPGPWDEQITAALKRCDAVVAVLTPHAVRTGLVAGLSGDESVCLDELAYARFSPPPTPIVPILLIPCEPPFIIYRLNYLDFLQTGADEVRYHDAFERLVTTIRALKTGDPPAYRSTRFEPLDFDLYLKSKTRDFVGRDWLSAGVFERLAIPDAPPVLLLVGEPGWGKTAFAGRLFGTNPGGQLLAAHFCRADRADSVDPRRFVESLVAMTAMRVPAFGARIQGLADQHEGLLAKGQIRDALERLFLEPLAALDPIALGKLPRYVLLDGLDEATTATGPSIVSLLAQTIELFPDWLRLVATTRNRPGVVDAFGAADILRLDHDDARNRRDVQMLIARLLEPPAAAAAAGTGGSASSRSSAPAAEDLLQIIDAKAKGNALCAAQLALAVRRSGMDVTAIAALPRGLTSLYRAILQRRFDPQGADWAIVRELLEMILATKAPLPIELATIARSDPARYATQRAIDSVSDLLSEDEGTLRLFHLTLAEFLTLSATPFFVNPVQGATRLADVALTPGRRAELPAPLKTFCGDNLRSWLLQCDSLGRYAASLRDFYDEWRFSNPARRGSGRVEGVVIEGEDERLIARLADAGQAQAVIDIILLAFARAEDRFRQSGALPWVTDGSKPRPDDALRAEIARAIARFFEIVCFGLAWTRALARAMPELQPQLRELITEQGRLRWTIGWIDLGVGCYSLGLSQYFEDRAYVIRQDWAEIESELT